MGQVCVTNWGSLIITNWGSCYKLGRPLLQNRVAITNWDKMYYKLGHVLQIRAIITNWGITTLSEILIGSNIIDLHSRTEIKKLSNEKKTML